MKWIYLIDFVLLFYYYNYYFFKVCSAQPKVQPESFRVQVQLLQEKVELNELVPPPSPCVHPINRTFFSTVHT